MRVTIERESPATSCKPVWFQTSIALTAERKVMKLQDYVKYLVCIFVVDLYAAIHCDGHITDASASFQVLICFNLFINPDKHWIILPSILSSYYMFTVTDFSMKIVGEISDELLNLYFCVRIYRDLLIRFIIRTEWDKNAAFWICSSDGSEAAVPAVSNSNNYENLNLNFLSLCCVSRNTEITHITYFFIYAVCGRPNRKAARLLGGENTESHEFPWLVNIHVKSKLLSGVLINDRYVMTAASQIVGFVNLEKHLLSLLHDIIEQRDCLQDNFYNFNKNFSLLDRATAPDIKVSLGEYDRCALDISSVNVSVESVIMHPEFNPEADIYDLALIRLSRPTKFEKRISPICMPNPGSFIGFIRDVTPIPEGYRDELLVHIVISGSQDRLISVRWVLWSVGPRASPRITLILAHADHGNWGFPFWDITSASSRE